MTKSPKYRNRDLSSIEEKRLVDLCDLYRQIHGKSYDFKEIVGKHANETLQDIACSENRYHQVIEFYCKKKQEMKAQQASDTDQVILDAKAILTRCLELMEGRNKKYGSSWRVLSVEAIASLCEMKMNRIATLGSTAPKTEDELMDNINYCVFALMKLQSSSTSSSSET